MENSKLCFVILLSGIFGLEEPVQYRLSGDTKPSFYSIKIHPDFDRNSFHGEVVIHIRNLRAVEAVEFHAKGLKFESVLFDYKKVEDLENNCCASFGYEFDDLDIVRIKKASCGGVDMIAAGPHTIFVKYNGIINLNVTDQGFIKGTQLNSSVIYVTDLESSSARKVFPCFDEPHFKAIFQLNIVSPKDSYIAISNSRLNEKVPITGGILYKFDQTPIMSPHIICFVLTDNNYTEHLNSRNTQYRIYAPEIDEEYNLRMLKFADDVIEYLSNYTQHESVIPKIGYDTGLEMEAMENWGLITINSTFLTPNYPGYNDNITKLLIAHELTHFWFGNLVSNKWWNDIWLHEGLTNFMSAKACDAIEKTFQFSKPSPETIGPLYSFDNLAFQSVLDYQDSPDMININFDSIVYDKGASILKMAEFLLGENNFRKAIIEYVEMFSYDSSSTDDFLLILSRHTDDINFRECMETFLFQIGFPVIYVEEVEDFYILHQKGQPNNASSYFGQKWTVPITYVTNLNKTMTTIWFHKDVDSISIPKYNSTWIHLNTENNIYYITIYSPNLWKEIIENLDVFDEDQQKWFISGAMTTFKLNLTSCDIILKILWETGKNNSFTFKTNYIDSYKTFLDNLDDGSDILLLNNFYGCILQKAGLNSSEIPELTKMPFLSKCDYSFGSFNTEPEQGNIDIKLRQCLKRLQISDVQLL